MEEKRPVVSRSAAVNAKMSGTSDADGGMTPMASLSPDEVVAAAHGSSSEADPSIQKRSQADVEQRHGEGHPSKKQRTTPTGSSIAAATPDMSSEASHKKPQHSHHPDDKPMPVSQVTRGLSSGSLSSEYSSVSASSNVGRHEEPMSPVKAIIGAPFSKGVPPAPPSTPASQASLASIDGAATPLPVLRSVANASLLEQQQRLLAEGAETPAPTRPHSNVKEKSSSPHLPEDFSDWEVGGRYKLMRVLGRGSYGVVAQALDLHAGRPDAFVAIKRIQSPFDQEVDAIRLYREIHILRHMRGHDCIINLLDIVQPPTSDVQELSDLYMVFEYVDTDLYKLIMSPQYLTTEHIQTFLYQMLVGLKYIHSFSVIHRDLKPANILLNEDCSLKICDFGLARIVDRASMSVSGQEDGKGSSSSSEEAPQTPSSFGSPPKLGLTRQLTKHVVTRWYRAPELILIQPYTSAVDIWSLGCILAELLSMQEGNVAGYQDRKPLFPGGFCFPLSGEGDSIKKDERLDQLSVIFKVIGTPTKEDIDETGVSTEYLKSLGKVEKKSFEDLFPAADPAALDLLKHMLLFNPKRRFTASEALEHDFFKGIRRKDLELNSSRPLEGPDFLNSHKVDLDVLKEKTLDEVRWFRDLTGKSAAN